MNKLLAAQQIIWMMISTVDGKGEQTQDSIMNYIPLQK